MDKTFAGSRLRRLREERGMNQVDLARQLAISASYLNQLEHDSRPLTVPVLIRLTELFGVDTAYFAPHDTPRLVADLREALPPRAARLASGPKRPTTLPFLSTRNLEKFHSMSPGKPDSLVR